MSWMPSAVVKLNVGGKYFETTVDTLTKYSDSMLFAWFSGKYAVQTDENGYVFLDRDGDRFRHILNYLRCGTVHIGEDIHLLGEILEEAEYFGLENLAQQLKEAIFHCRLKQDEKKSSLYSGLQNEDSVFQPVFETVDGLSQTSQGETLSQEFRLDEDF
ncbi:hypothetical protein GAYE_SCF04G2507 [Galdieria yellowstonensis]|uniref:BTB domain-containing protein n=1 Tax=Galdieria yellowstonensis TaxID=3028027 RepID=A0AAV9IBM8_9RHOD|nr:hypothetical protein GAYE_SCF04G2507 [Galdieria yellowstonensis]